MPRQHQNNTPSTNRKPGRFRLSIGFSLIELMMVVVVLAVIAGAVSWAIGPTIDRATLREAISRVAQMDHLSRVIARRQNASLLLSFSPDGDRIDRLLVEDDSPLGAACELPRRCRITTVLEQNGEESTDQAIMFGSRGWSQSYAVELQSATASRWLLFSGPTGQVTEVESEDEVRQTLARSSRGHDAD